MLLPTGTGAIASNGTVRTITISWLEEGAAYNLIVEAQL